MVIEVLLNWRAVESLKKIWGALLTVAKQRGNHTLIGISITVFLVLFIWGSSYGLYYIYSNIEKLSELFSALWALLVISVIIVFISWFLELVRISTYKDTKHSLATFLSTLLSISQIILASSLAIIVSMLLVSRFFNEYPNSLLEQLLILILCSVICILFYIVIVVKVLRKRALKFFKFIMKKMNNPIRTDNIRFLDFPNQRNQSEIKDLQKSRAFFERLATFSLFYYAILSGWVNPEIKTIFDILDNQYAFTIFLISFSTYSYCAIFSLPFITNECKE